MHDVTDSVLDRFFFIRLPNGLDVEHRSHPGDSNIELAMCECRSSEVQANMLDSLALRLVNGHGKAKPDRKLPPTELECHLLLCWIVVDSGDENLALCMVSCDKLNLHHPMGVSSQDTPAPIAYPICCIQVFKDNHRTAQLDLQFGERHPTTVDIIQVLHRIVKHGIIPPILFRSRNGVCTVKELDMPRKGHQQNMTSLGNNLDLLDAT